MQDSDLIKIRVTKLIRAPKWKIIRLITRVNEFPEYMPNVKEASVIEKRHNIMKTKWRVQVDGVPISWIEEDNLAFNDNAIYFRAIQGDLKEFRGEWTFGDHAEGTEVVVNVFLRVGIPAIKDFADAYIQKMVTRNFEAILDSLERKIITIKYTGHKNGDKPKISGFGIIGHLYNFQHFEKCLKMLDPNFKMPSEEFLEKLFHLTPSFKLYDILNFKSKTEQVANGCFIVATFIPEMIDKDVATVFAKVVKACKIAEKYGVGIVTLGGLTSVVGERMGQQISEQVNVPLTTGNTFTAAMTIDGVLKAAQALDRDMSSLKATIVGGTGDIGSACSVVLAVKIKQLTITGRTKPNLAQLKQRLSKMHKAKIIATTDNESAVKDADIVIAAASVNSAILNPGWFKPGAIISDVGYPKNVSHVEKAREDILLFSGGLAKIPSALNFPIDMGLPAPDIIYGAYAEGIILDLEKRYEKFSNRKTGITPEKIDEIRSLGAKHGFQVSDFYWGNKLIGGNEIAGIKQRPSE